MGVKYVSLSVLFFLSILNVNNANAWVFSENVTVKNMIQWQGDSPIYFTLSNGTRCYIPATEKNMYSLILSAFATSKSMDVHCHDTLEEYGGISGHRLNRVFIY